MNKLFLDHPRTVDETYGEHALVATSFGVRMVLAGLACLIHAVIPGLFVRTGSAMIARLHDEMVVNRNRKAAAKRAANTGSQAAVR